jgi:hypothetical protein
MVCNDLIRVWQQLIQSTQNVFAYEEETQTLQRRCSIMFELSVSLLRYTPQAHTSVPILTTEADYFHFSSTSRMVEAISLETPRAILDEELNIARICELLLYVVSRTTTGAPSASTLSQFIMRLSRPTVWVCTQRAKRVDL